MIPSLEVRPEDGALEISDRPSLVPGQQRSDVAAIVADLIDGRRDHGNGYEWLYLRSLKFGGHPSGLALCFKDGRLCELGWNVRLPDEDLEGGWPTRESSNREIAFVRKELQRQLGFPSGLDTWRFKWGTVWSSFDDKGFSASNGIRYELQTS